MTDNGGPAFPTIMPPLLALSPSGEVKTIEAQPTHFPGMTLRDWFAGQALKALSALVTTRGGTSEALSKTAYGIADAMLAERLK